MRRLFQKIKAATAKTASAPTATPTPTPIFAPLLRPSPEDGFDVGVFEGEIEVDTSPAVKVGVCVRAEAPIVAAIERPSLLLQHVLLEPPQHQVPSLHCITAEFFVGVPPR